MTITAAPSDLFKTQEQCIDAAANAIKDYRSTMEKVVESWLKNELGTIEQLAEAIGRSPKTLKTDYVSALRKQGRLPASSNSRTGPRKKRSGRSGRSENPERNVENSEPEVEQVQVVVEEPTPTPNAPKPTPTPEPAPSAPRSKSSESIQWKDDPCLSGWNGSLNDLSQQIYKREVASSRSRVRMAEQLAGFKDEIEKTMRAASNNHRVKAGKLLETDVKMVEATLQQEGRPGIQETLKAVIHEAERIQKFASETLRLLQYTT
tara:strand:- start:74 stop:862 length:789 start_codon:yes stop_codon:yes gene_type:complete